MDFGDDVSARLRETRGRSNASMRSAWRRGLLASTALLAVGGLPASGAQPAIGNPQYWNGTTTTSGASVIGGNGSWTNSAFNWTDATGRTPQAWQSGSGVFAGPTPPEDPSTQEPEPYIVKVDDAIQFQTLRFSTSGYKIVTGSGTLTATGSATITTDSGITATIATPLGGSVGLTKAGAGTLTLTGTQTYTGGTTISAGTLQIGDGTTSGSIVGNIVNNATLSFSLAGSTSTTYAGVISGSGLVNVYGPDPQTATLTLTGNNTFTGGISILTKAMLSVASDQNLGAASGSVKFYDGTLILADGFTSSRAMLIGSGGTIQVDTGTATLTGMIAPTNAVQGGSLSKTGNGTLVVSGANTADGFTLFGGTLKLGAAGVLSTKSAVVMQGGTFDLNGNSIDIGNFYGSSGRLTNGSTTAATLTSSAVNNAGVGLVYTGNIVDGVGTIGVGLRGGRLFLGGNDTYSGATTLSGTAILAARSTTAFSPNSVFTLNGNSALDLSGYSNTVGSLAGTGIVSNENRTNVAATLTIGTNNASTTFSGTIQDGSFGAVTGLTKSGTGTLTLASANTYSGATSINAGTLEVDGSIASQTIVVNSGGTLSGTGKIGDPQINAGGTLAPGSTANPYGTLTIVGPLSFAAGSFYNVNISPNQNSRTNVVGLTTIAGGTVRVTAGSGTYVPSTRYTILNATGGVTGTFAAEARTNMAFLTPTLSYDANNVYLTITPTHPTAAGTPDYTTAAATGEEAAVAAALTEAGMATPGGRGGRLLTALDQVSVSQARAVFEGLSGEGITAAQNAAFRSAQLFNSSIFDQTTFYGGDANAITLTAPAPIRELADLPASHIAPIFVAPTRTWRAWATGFGGTEDIHGGGATGAAAQASTLYGGALGVDYQLTPDCLVGVALGGSDATFRVSQRATSGSTTGGHVAIYDIATFGSFYGASSTSFSDFDNKTTRVVAGFGGLGGETERGRFNSREIRTRLEFGRHFETLPGVGGLPVLSGFGTITPFVALEIADLRSNGFGETAQSGAGLFRLNVSGQSIASVPGFVGLRLQRATPTGDGLAFAPSLQVAWVHEFAPYRSQVAGLADLPGATFLVDGARPAYNAAQVKIGGELKLGRAAALFANFDGEFSGANQLYTGKGGFRYAW